MSIPTGPAGAGNEPGSFSTDHVACRARGGDETSCDELFRRIAPALYTWARLHIRGVLRRRLDPEDVLQEVACRALSGFHGWDEAKGTFRAYTFGIAKNVLKRALEHLARDPKGPSEGASLPSSVDSKLIDSATTLTRAVARDESLRRFVDELELLPDDDRRLMLHRGLEGLPHEDVARLLRISTDAVEKRWQRLCERLRGDARFQSLVA